MLRYTKYCAMGLFLIVVLFSLSITSSYAAVQTVQTYTENVWSNTVYYIGAISGYYGQTQTYQDINLYIETNEESVCKYSFDNCNFEFDDGIDMTGIGREHQTLWKVGKTYYIRCKDLWDNMPDKCTIELKTT